MVSLLFDSDNNRRSLYGKAGAFRLQPWGIEYRSLSSAMMASTALLETVYNQIITAVDAFNHRRSLPDAIATQTAINNSDVELAKKLIEKYNLYFIEQKLKAASFITNTINVDLPW